MLNHSSLTTLPNQNGFVSLQAQKWGNCDLCLAVHCWSQWDLCGGWVGTGPYKYATSNSKAYTLLWIDLSHEELKLSVSRSVRRADGSGHLTRAEKKNSRCTSSLQYPHILSPRWKLKDKNNVFHTGLFSTKCCQPSPPLILIKENLPSFWPWTCSFFLFLSVHALC